MIIPNTVPIKGIIQVGAERGNEVDIFVRHTSNIICFEPVEETFGMCVSKSKQYPNHNIHVYNYVISDTIGEVEFFVAKDRQCSSLFDLNPNAAQVHLNNCSQDKKVKYNSITLDGFFKKHINEVKKEDYNYLCIDVQGAEHLVILGASDLLKNIDFIWMEVSYSELYKNTLLYEDMVKFVEGLGYKLIHNQPFNDVQGDVLFVKSN